MRHITHIRLHRQRGVVLIFTLIILLILTIGAVALMRSMNSSLTSAGNLAFRRDLTNQGEQAVANVMTAFKAGGALSTSAVTDSNVPANNYSATMLATNAQGVPNILLSQDSTFNSTGFTSSANDVAGAPDLPGGLSSISIRYVVDRMCTNTGATVANQCVQSSAAPLGGTANGSQSVTPPSATVYRLSVRVSGARSTQVFLQTTFTRQD
jgi:type IV pilus assembly protein PilX